MTMDFQQARIQMVDNQIRPTDVTSHSVLAAFLDVPREEFVPEKFRELAYIDSDIELSCETAGGSKRFIMEPSPLAKLVQLANITSSDIVLEIGTGSGYSAAILSKLASYVVTVEIDTGLSAAAGERFSKLGFENINAVTGKLTDGYIKEAPFDVIMFNGAIEVLPKAISDQLSDGGRLVAVEGTGNASKAVLYVKNKSGLSSSRYFNTSIQPLPGFEKDQEFVF